MQEWLCRSLSVVRGNFNWNSKFRWQNNQSFCDTQFRGSWKIVINILKLKEVIRETVQEKERYNAHVNFLSESRLFYVTLLIKERLLSPGRWKQWQRLFKQTNLLSSSLHSSPGAVLLSGVTRSSKLNIYCEALGALTGWALLKIPFLSHINIVLPCPGITRP